MIAERADGRLIEQHDSSGRKLRNRIVIANAVAWIVIMLAICLIFL